ncbi:YciC family protein [Pseudomonas helleri]|uniref:YciC family protein n=1 Tax=Pseudomonas helleri TaxID=1608996 RepID=UPI0028E746AE|nr:YciC family protein [Pseudomonas helleri]
MNPLTVLRDSLYFIQRNLGQVITLCLPLVILEAVLQYVVDDAVGPNASQGYALIVGLLVYPLYTGALIVFLDARSRGESPSNRDVLARALSLWPKFALLAAISTLLIVLGLSMFFIPGIYLTVVLAFSEYNLVLRGQPPLTAIKSSLIMSRGHFWRIFVCILAVMGPLLLLKQLSFSLVPEDTSAVVTVALESFNSFLQLFLSVVLFRLFMLISEKSDA